ncbi:hypothetical protein GCM10027258_63060 [Amycolatopsis stemonae]
MTDTYTCPDEAPVDEQTAVERAMEVDAADRLQYLREKATSGEVDFERLQLRNSVANRLQPFIAVARASEASDNEIAEGLAVVAMAVFDSVREENLRLQKNIHRAHDFLGEISLELLDVAPDSGHALDKIRALKSRIDPVEYRRVDRLYAAAVRNVNMLHDVIEGLCQSTGDDVDRRPRPAMEQRYSLGYGHLLERRDDDVCTCDAPVEAVPGGGAHRDWCGWEPVVALDDLPGLLAFHFGEPPAGPIRLSKHVARHLYCGPGNDHEIAVTVGAHDKAWSLFLLDAANAYIAAGHRPPVELPAPEPSPYHALDVAEAAAAVEVPEVAEAIPDVRPAAEPNGCRWCGIGQREHGGQWIDPVGWHSWGAPSNAQRLERMKARRAAALARRAGEGCPCCRTFDEPQLSPTTLACVGGLEPGGCGHPGETHAARARVTVGSMTPPVPAAPEVTTEDEDDEFVELVFGEGPPAETEPVWPGVDEAATVTDLAVVPDEPAGGQG